MKACFIGLGYIGLPTAIIAADNGVMVHGVDINPEVVMLTNNSELHLIEPHFDKLLKKVVEAGFLKASSSPELSDVYVICVPTPVNSDNAPDVSFVEAAAESLIPFLKAGDLVILESTSPVGTTRRISELIFGQRPELRNQIYIAYCPERMIPGKALFELVHNDRVVGGIDNASTRKACEFYAHFVKGKLHPTDSETAEMCKLVENSSRDVQIAFANELSIICDKIGIDVVKLIELANKHPRVNILQPGCGVGGHCIAVDPYFITHSFPNEAKLIARAREINTHKTAWCAEKISNLISDFELEFGRTPVVALMGLSFKPDIDDLRESPALCIVNEVLLHHANIEFLIVEPNISRHSLYKLTDYNEAVDKADIIVFLVKHSLFNNLNIGKNKRVLNFCGVEL